MAVKNRSTIIEEPIEGSTMYIVINQTNSFDPANTQRFATEAEAETKATEILTANPGHVVVTAKLLKSFKAAVTIEGTPIETAA